MENKRVKSKWITGFILAACFIVIMIATSGYLYDAHQRELKQLKDDQHYQNDVKG